MSLKKELISLFDKLLSSFGPRNWWPADSKFEVVIGAILAQNTAWKNVKKAISNIKNNNLMNPEKLYLIEENVLAEIVKTSGYFRQKAKKIKNFLKFFKEKYDFSFEKMALQKKDILRKELIGVWGIGEETADSILLYALNIPSFVVDSYTKRIFLRLGYFNKEPDYFQLKKFFEDNLPEDVYIYNEFHA
ncbi:hypothetical protein DRQ09_07790, partial [candidate division KSB1 bacterium]